MFIAAIWFIGLTVVNAIPLKCVSMNNQESKEGPTIANNNSNEPLFYPYSVLMKKCGGDCNGINNSHA